MIEEQFGRYILRCARSTSRFAFAVKIRRTFNSPEWKGCIGGSLACHSRWFSPSRKEVSRYFSTASSYVCTGCVRKIVQAQYNGGIETSLMNVDKQTDKNRVNDTFDHREIIRTARVRNVRVTAPWLNCRRALSNYCRVRQACKVAQRLLRTRALYYKWGLIVTRAGCWSVRRENLMIHRQSFNGVWHIVLSVLICFSIQHYFLIHSISTSFSILNRYLTLCRERRRNDRGTLSMTSHRARRSAMWKIGD